MRAGPTEGREREGMWADAGRDRDHAGLPGDVDCRSLGFLPACRAQAQALLLIIRVLFIIRPGAAGAPLLVLLIIRLLFITEIDDQRSDQSVSRHARTVRVCRIHIALCQRTVQCTAI